MGLVAGDTSFTKSFVLKGKRPHLFFVTLSAGLVRASHRQSSGRLKNIASVRVVALYTIHVVFGHRMVVWKIEFSLDIKVALEAG